ncbi:Protein nedd1 [Phlyctochytrium bullatum]|nr:Protein nedd1 [Phlyctochytrium bullatum]
MSTARLASVSSAARVWDLQSASATSPHKQILHVPVTTFNPPLYSSHLLDGAWSFDGKYFVTCGTDNVMSVFDLKTSKVVEVIPGVKGPGHKEIVNTLAVSVDEQSVLSGAGAGELLLFSLKTNTPTHLTSPFKQGVTKVGFSPFKKSIVGATGQEGVLALWDVLHSPAPTLLIRDAHIAPSSGLCFSPCHASILATSGFDRKVKIFDRNEKGKVLMEFLAESPVASLSLNDDFLVAAGTMNGKIMVFDIRAKGLIHTFSAGDNAAVASLSFDPPQWAKEACSREVGSSKAHVSSMSLAASKASKDNLSTATGPVSAKDTGQMLAALKERVASAGVSVRDKQSLMDMFSPVKANVTAIHDASPSTTAGSPPSPTTVARSNDTMMPPTTATAPKFDALASRNRSATESTAGKMAAPDSLSRLQEAVRQLRQGAKATATGDGADGKSGFRTFASKLNAADLEAPTPVGNMPTAFNAATDDSLGRPPSPGTVKASSLGRASVSSPMDTISTPTPLTALNLQGGPAGGNRLVAWQDMTSLKPSVSTSALARSGSPIPSTTSVSPPGLHMKTPTVGSGLLDVAASGPKSTGSGPSSNSATGSFHSPTTSPVPTTVVFVPSAVSLQRPPSPSSTLSAQTPHQPSPAYPSASLPPSGAAAMDPSSLKSQATTSYKPPASPRQSTSATSATAPSPLRPRSPSPASSPVLSTRPSAIEVQQPPPRMSSPGLPLEPPSALESTMAAKIAQAVRAGAEAIAAESAKAAAIAEIRAKMPSPVPSPAPIKTEPPPPPGLNLQQKVLEGIIEDCLMEFRDQIRHQIQDMHIELLRQFHMQKNEIEQLLFKHAPSTALYRELHHLREENARLRCGFASANELQRVAESLGKPGNLSSPPLQPDGSMHHLVAPRHGAPHREAKGGLAFAMDHHPHPPHSPRTPSPTPSSERPLSPTPMGSVPVSVAASAVSVAESTATSIASLKQRFAAVTGSGGALSMGPVPHARMGEPDRTAAGSGELGSPEKRAAKVGGGAAGMSPSSLPLSKATSVRSVAGAGAAGKPGVVPRVLVEDVGDR